MKELFQKAEGRDDSLVWARSVGDGTICKECRGQVPFQEGEEREGMWGGEVAHSDILLLVSIC